VLAVQVATIFPTGFKDRRYFILFLLYLAASMLWMLNRCLPGGLWRPRSSRALWLAAAAAIVFVPTNYVYSYYCAGGVHDWFHPGVERRFLEGDDCTAVLAEMRQDTPRPCVLIISGPITAFRFGALTGCPTLVVPSNLTAASLVPLLRQYRVTHVLDPEHALPSTAGLPLKLTALQTPGLTRVEFQP
jgi:hypothetical protein